MAFAVLVVAAIRASLKGDLEPRTLTRLAYAISADAEIPGYGPRDVEATIRGSLGDVSISSYLNESPESEALAVVTILTTIIRSRRDDVIFLESVDTAAEYLIATEEQLISVPSMLDQMGGVKGLERLAAKYQPADSPRRETFMERPRWPIGPHGPRTFVGEWLRVTVSRDKHMQAVNRAEKIARGFEWRRSDLDFLEIAFDMAVNAYIQPPGSVEDAIVLVRNIYAKFDKERLPKMIDFEAIVRNSVGDWDISFDGIKTGDFLLTYSATITHICDVLEIATMALNGLLGAAEETAIDGGWEPVLLAPSPAENRQDPGNQRAPGDRSG